jgi:hypothetical protein
MNINRKLPGNGLSADSEHRRLPVFFPLSAHKIHTRSISPTQENFPPPGAGMPVFGRMIMKAALLSVIFLIGPGITPAETKGKISLGAVENVVLLPWGVTMPARIDTGAATSSLDARNIAIKGDAVEFNLPPQYGGRKIRLPLLKVKTVKSAEAKDRRPVVMVEFCIGSKRILTRVNLNDRSNVKYPILIGRNTLMHDFVIDCGTSYCTQPSCPEVAPR